MSSGPGAREEVREGEWGESDEADAREMISRARACSLSPFPTTSRLLARPPEGSVKPAVTVSDRPAAELYGVRPDFKRFDPMTNMIWFPRCESEGQRLARIVAENRQKRMASGERGYEPLDLALLEGASAMAFHLKYGVNIPWLRGNDWIGRDYTSPQPDFPPLTKRSEPVPLEPARASAAVKRAARAYGADLVGLARLDRRWVYSHYVEPETNQHYPIRFSDEPGLEGIDRPSRLADGTLVIPDSVDRAVVVALEMDLEGIRSAPTLREMATTTVSYAWVEIVTMMLAEFIRSLGYHAIPSANCTALSIPLAVDAGLGELGRNAKLITPRFGPRVRLGKVLTNMPLEPDKAIEFGVKEFCTRCRRCAHECPASAIPHGDRSYETIGAFNQPAVLQWQVDHRRCFEYFTEAGTNCGVCLAVCPYNKGMGWVKGVSSSFDCSEHKRELDEIFGYGRTADLDRYWE